MLPTVMVVVAALWATGTVTVSGLVDRPSWAVMVKVSLVVGVAAARCPAVGV
jgi:hypothetical protein